MRILITCTGPWGTGSSTVAYSLQKELKKLGMEVLIFFPDGDLPHDGLEHYYKDHSLFKTIPFPANHNGIYFKTFPLILPDPNPRNHKNAWTYKDLTAPEINACTDYYRQELIKVINEFKPHVIECQHIWILDYIVAKLGFSFISVAHNSDQIGFHYDQRMQSITRWSANEADYIFAISHDVRDKVIELYGANPKKVIIFNNGYDEELFKPIKVNREEVVREFKMDVDADTPILTFCGKLSRTKGIDVLLKANKIIQAKTKAHIAFLGSGDLDGCLDLGGDYCFDNTTFLGHRSPQDMIKLHNISKLSLLPSRSEGFSIAALEAMGCGLPLVATKVGGMPQITVGSLVEPEDVEGLANAILDILSMPESSYNTLKQDALNMAKRYSWESIVEKRFPFYELVAFKNSHSEKDFHNIVQIA